jgi:hypothetical protein
MTICSDQVWPSHAMLLIRSHLRYNNLLSSLTRAYATVDSATIVARPPRPPVPTPAQEPDPRSAIDSHILAALPKPGQTSLPELITQYVDRSGHVLDFSLPYEHSPVANRRVDFDAKPEDSSVSVIAHCARDGGVHKITLCSGFALEGPGHRESLILTCAHTLEEASSRLKCLCSRIGLTGSGLRQIRRSPILRLPPKHSPPQEFDTSCISGTFAITGGSVPGPNSTCLHPISSVLSSLRRSDLLLLSKTGPPQNALPVSPYPAPQHTRIRAHFVVDRKPDESGWMPWVGGMWCKWVRGSVLGYRDFAGREAQVCSIGFYTLFILIGCVPI